VLLWVDHPHGAHVGLVAGGTRRALVGVHAQHAVREYDDHVRVLLVDVPNAVAGLDFREHHVVRGVDLVDVLHRTDVDAGPVLHSDAGFVDDGDAGYSNSPFEPHRP
jgi:hypothetical protein